MPHRTPLRHHNKLPKQHHAFVYAVQTAASLKSVAALVAEEAMRQVQAENAWLIHWRSDQNRPALFYAPEHVRLPGTMPDGLALWVQQHRQVLMCAGGKDRRFKAAGSLAEAFCSLRPQPEFVRRWELDRAWLGTAAQRGELIFVPMEGVLQTPTVHAVKILNLLILKRRDWPAAALKALDGFLPTAQLAMNLSEQRSQVEQRLRHAKAVSEIAENMSATLDLDVLLRLILLEMTKALQCQAGDIWLKAEKQINLVFKTSLGLGPAIRGLLTSGERSRQAMEQAEPIWLEELSDLAQDILPGLEEEGIRSMAVVPLKTKSKVIGVMHIYSHHKKTFTLEERNLLKILVNQAAIAIDQARMFEETKRRAQELLALYEITQMITEKTNLNQSLKNIVDRVGEVLNVEKCWFMFYDKGKQMLLAHPAAFGLDDEQLDLLEFSTQSAGFAGHVFRSGRPMFTNSAESEPAIQAEFKKLFILRTIMVVPLRSREENLGIFIAANKRDRSTFKGNDVRFFSTLASETTAVIENAMLTDQLNRRFLSVLQAITDIVDTREPYIPGHSRRVSVYAVSLAEKLMLAGEEVERIRMAGFLHDIGKIDLITAALTTAPQDLDRLRQHPEIGARFLEKVEFPMDLKDLVQNHHEHFDGTGYPQGVQGENIPLGARVIAVADAYDMLTSSLDPAACLAPQAAYECLQQQAGKKYDPRVVEMLGEIWPVFEGTISYRQSQFHKK